MEAPRSIEVRHILCPVDFSAISDIALRYAEVAARQFGARLTVLHAERFELPRYLLRGLKRQLADELNQAKAHLADELRRHAETILEGALPSPGVRYVVEATEAAEAVLQWTREAEVDLVVMGTHGISGFKRVMMGSVAEAVVRQAGVPVFTVRPRAQAFIDGQSADAKPVIDAILCPLIPETTQLEALHYAAALAERFEAALTVLHVVENDSAPGEAEIWLKKTMTAAVGTRCPWTAEVHAGRAAEQIITIVERRKIDMVVIGARHRFFADAAIFGRTTELVVRHAPAPVLVVPIPAGE